MTRSTFVKAAAVATLAAASFVPAAAQAQTLFSFNGAANILDPDGRPNSSTGQLVIDFLIGEVGNGATPGTILATSETDLIGVVEGTTTGEIRDLTVEATGFAGLPVSPFVTIGGYTFTLDGQDGTSNNAIPNGFGPITLRARGSRGSEASFAVNGRVMGPGLNMGSTYTGIFTAQFAQFTPAQLIARIDAGNLVNTSFSAQFSIQNGTVIPEPSTYALMASGVAMLGVFARRRRQA